MDMMRKTKLVYKDGNSNKVLWGEITHEDEMFITFITIDGNKFRINTKQVVSIKDLGGRNGS
jgi:hypothetical protein